MKITKFITIILILRITLTKIQKLPKTTNKQTKTKISQKITKPEFSQKKTKPEFSQKQTKTKFSQNSTTCVKASLTPDLHWKFTNECNDKKIKIKICLEKKSEKFCVEENLDFGGEFVYEDCLFTECALFSLEDEIL